jgi:hypothetical protein
MIVVDHDDILPVSGAISDELPKRPRLTHGTHRPVFHVEHPVGFGQAFQISA